ncbi:MAG TPA: HEAT repeat domain-containing protein [Planctomycetota bacterium]|nr:HEAT repeat domain-containing protein [Planctomycetota bacterium]
MQPHEQKKAIRWMAGQPLPWLKKHLEGDDRLFRNAAILALGHRKGDREATRLLLALCDGDDVDDAGSAAIALAIQGEPEAREVVARFAAADDPLLREGAVNAIAESRDESLYPLLSVLAEDADARVRSAAQDAAARLRGPARPEHPGPARQEPL